MAFVIAYPKALPNQLAHPGRGPQLGGVPRLGGSCQQRLLQLLALLRRQPWGIPRRGFPLQPLLPMFLPDPIPAADTHRSGAQSSRHLRLTDSGGKQPRRLQAPLLQRPQIPWALPDDRFHAWVLPCVCPV